MSAAAPQTGRLRGLDTLRAAAIVSVVLYHAFLGSSSRWLVRVVHSGALGVDLFFVLSGYLIASQYFAKAARGQQVPIGQFYVKRLFRTLPCYFVVLAISYAIVVGYLHETWPSAWKYPLFLQNFGVVFPAIVVSWSLCIEEQFYLVFPFIVRGLLALRSIRAAALVVALVLVGGLAIRTRLWFLVRPDRLVDWPAYFKYFYYPTYNRLDGLTLGVCLAACHRLRPTFWARTAPYADRIFVVGVLTSLAGAAANYSPFTLLSCGPSFLIVAVGFTLVVASALHPGSWLARIRIPGTPLLALLSYSMYLAHEPALRGGKLLAARIGVADRTAAVLVIQGALVMVGTVLLYFLVERPFLGLRDKLVRSEQRMPEEASRANAPTLHTATPPAGW
jgi:peptidoglycan/LPS O-acetylase OafA/YrhL